MRRIALRATGVVAMLFAILVAYVVVRNRPLPPNEYDVPILRAAIVLLETDSLWSKHDDRTCDPTAARRGLYCALQRASLDVAGTFRHRAASLQAVRRAIDAIRPDNGYAHRLQDFNNAPDVTLATVHEVLHRAIGDLTSERDRGN
jgi:hypothetical protein